MLFILVKMRNLNPKNCCFENRISKYNKTNLCCLYYVSSFLFSSVFHDSKILRLYIGGNHNRDLIVRTTC